MDPDKLNFDKCFLCQRDDTSDLLNPKNYQHKSTTASHNAYESISTLILQWTGKKDEYPFEHDLNQLNNIPDGLATFLYSKNAKYHKACRSKIDKQKFERAKSKKRTSSAEVN